MPTHPAPVKGMILAAGRGTRVRPLTRHIPKPMIPILGRPVMEYLIEHLARHSVNDIMVNVAWHHSQIETYFGDGNRWGVELGYSYEGARDNGDIVPKPMGSAGAMRKIQDFGGFFDTTTLVVCGDALFDLDITAAVAEHRERNALATVITTDVPLSEVQNYGIVLTHDDGRVSSFQEKPSAEQARSTRASTGIYIFEPQIVDLIPAGIPFDIGGELFPLLVKKGLPFYAQNRSFSWIDIGRVSDYWTVLQRVLRGEVADMKMPGKQVRPDVWVGLNTSIDWQKVNIRGPVYIGSGSRIEAGASIIGPSWIGHGSHIRANASITRSVIFEYTRVGAGMTIEDSILSPQYCVHRQGEAVFVGDDETALRWGDARL
jgi:mannose-1-phosphate guanylyltransferase